MAEPESTIAWEPLTPRGVATFARATSSRLFIVQMLVALLVAATVGSFLYNGWFPTIRDGIKHLPDEGEINLGRLDWHGDSPRMLAEGNFLAFSVDLDHAGEIRSPADVQLEFGRKTILLRSLLGYTEISYPPRWIISFNREELEPWWGAWQPALAAMTMAGVVLGLLFLWYALATLYAFPVWLLAFFGNRDLKMAECCRLAGAALMPGALLMAVGIVLYDFGVVDLVGLGFITGGHLVLGWIYLFISPLFLPRAAEVAAQKKNPFVTPGDK